MDYSENELISEIKKRNHDAFEILIQTYTKPVYYLAYTILKISCNKEDIEECVSDVFLDIWNKIKEFDSEKGGFRTWILILTKYRALAYKRKSEKTHVENIEDFQLESSYDVAGQVLDRETQEKLIETIDTFNEVDRALFIRRYFCGESIGDLMESFGLTRPAVDNRLLRSRKMLKEAISYE